MISKDSGERIVWDNIQFLPATEEEKLDAKYVEVLKVRVPASLQSYFPESGYPILLELDLRVAATTKGDTRVILEGVKGTPRRFSLYSVINAALEGGKPAPAGK